MLCKNCGKEVPDNLSFCPFCGFSLNADNAATVPNDNAQNSGAASNDQNGTQNAQGYTPQNAPYSTPNTQGYTPQNAPYGAQNTQSYTTQNGQPIVESYTTSGGQFVQPGTPVPPPKKNTKIKVITAVIIIAVTLISIIVALAGGTGNRKKEKVLYKDDIITVAGETAKLPKNYDEFQKNGFTAMFATQWENEVEPKHYQAIFSSYGDFKGFIFFVKNESDSTKTANECNIVATSFLGSNANGEYGKLIPDDVAGKVKMPNDITLSKSTLDDIKEAYGSNGKDGTDGGYIYISGGYRVEFVFDDDNVLNGVVIIPKNESEITDNITDTGLVNFN